jgi:hypothetical protein
MEKTLRPKFIGGHNIAMKIPPHEFSSTVEFYGDFIGLPLIEEEAPNIVFDFGGTRLWLDEVPHISQAEIWLELHCDDVKVAGECLKNLGVVRRDGIEPLPNGFEGFWISNPAGIVHLVSRGQTSVNE